MWTNGTKILNKTESNRCCQHKTILYKIENVHTTHVDGMSYRTILMEGKLTINWHNTHHKRVINF